MNPMQRVRRTFWTLVLIAVLAAGALTRALTWSNEPLAVLAIIVSGLTATLAALLALRILVVTSHKPDDHLTRRSEP